MHLKFGFPFTNFCPYLRHRYPSPDIPTSSAARTTNFGFFAGFTAESKHIKSPSFNLVIILRIAIDH